MFTFNLLPAKQVPQADKNKVNEKQLKVQISTKLYRMPHKGWAITINFSEDRAANHTAYTESICGKKGIQRVF